MKSCLAILALGWVFLLCGPPTCAQAFWVKCDDDRSRYIVRERLNKIRIKMAYSEEEADYIIECHINHPADLKSKYKGYVIISDKMGIEIQRTKEIKRNACAANGFNPSADIFQVIAEDYLPELIHKITAP